ncbi:MAG: protease inhibitor Inh/omp19 family protein [Xanthobacteraceae bacterium]|nr:protease inhibitor Inh/omp19 family protein [Xanthobacteraceae bacterium]
MRLVAGILLALSAIASQAAGQTPAPAGKPDPAEVRALAANYELANADGNRKCPMTLETRHAGPGFALAYNRSQCSQLFGFLGEVAAWLPGIAGAILFVRSNGRTVAEFTEGVGGVYEAIREGDAVYFLANLQFVDPSERPQITDLFGDWNLSRPGAAPICRITLSDEATGEMFVVRMQPGCDATVARFEPVSWRLDRDDVVLLSPRGDVMRFGRQEGGGWAKVPETPRPLLMTRPE